MGTYASLKRPDDASNYMLVTATDEPPADFNFDSFLFFPEITRVTKSSAEGRTYGNLYLIEYPEESGFNTFLLYSLFFNGAQGEFHDRLFEKVEGLYLEDCCPAVMEEIEINLLLNNDGLRFRSKLNAKMIGNLHRHTTLLHEGSYPASYQVVSPQHLYLWIQL
jgi:hypothetical protein